MVTRIVGGGPGYFLDAGESTTNLTRRVHNFVRGFKCFKCLSCDLTSRIIKIGFAAFLGVPFCEGVTFN